MKNFIILTVFLFISVVAFAQVDRSHYPDPAPAPEIHIPSAETFTLSNGLKVFVVENHKLPRIAMSLIFDRDPVFEGDKAGTMELFGDMMMGGTVRYSKDQLNEAIDQIGASMNFGSGSAYASALTKYQETLFELFNEVLLHPVFPQEELDKAIKMKLSDLEYAKNDPGTITRVVSNAVLYGKDHPYGESVTRETVNSLKVGDFKTFYDTYYRPNGAYLAIVGDITLKEAKKLVSAHFSAWEKGDVPTHKWEVSQAPDANQVILVDRPSSVQSMINITYPVALQQNSPDRIKVSLLNYILGGGSSSRLFMNLREDKGYTYGAYSSLSPDQLVGEFSAQASVRTEVTDSAINAFFEELNRLNEQTISQKELDLAKASISGQFGRSLEQPSTIASFAINKARYDLPEDYYTNFLKHVDAVGVDELNAIAPRYIKPKHSYIVVVGNTSAFEDKINTYGAVSRYSVEGNPVQGTQEAPADVDPQEIIEHYLTAIGGREKLEGVQSVKEVATGEVQGMSMTQEFAVDKAKGMGIQRTLLGPQELSKVLITKDKVVAISMGQEQGVPEAMAKSLQGALKIFPELEYNRPDVQLELAGVEEVGGKSCYKVIVDQDGTRSTEYYAIESGLKVRIDNPLQGQVLYGEYKAYDGILIPSEVRVQAPNMPAEIKMVLSEMQINPVLEAADLQ